VSLNNEEKKVLSFESRQFRTHKFSGSFFSKEKKGKTDEILGE